jgi:hypothetical protein
VSKLFATLKEFGERAINNGEMLSEIIAIIGFRFRHRILSHTSIGGQIPMHSNFQIVAFTPAWRASL